jgi:hypothetical protein
MGGEYYDGSYIIAKEKRLEQTIQPLFFFLRDYFPRNLVLM